MPVGVVAVTTLVVGGVAMAPVSSASSSSPAIRGADSASAIPGSYLVKLKDDASVRADGLSARAQSLSKGHHGKLGHVWDKALYGFSAQMSAADAKSLAADPDVEYVMQDQRIAGPGYGKPQPKPGARAASGAGVSPAVATGPRAGLSVVPAGAQTGNISWGLDRIDQHALPLDHNYAYDDKAGQGVTAYILSGGVNNVPDLGGRLTLGPNFIPDGRDSSECGGVGTEEAGIIGGTTFGVAKKASMVSVRVFGCDSVATETSIMDGFNWVATHAVKPAVINFDLADLCKFTDGHIGPCDPSVAQANVAAQAGADAAGVSVVAMAGDSAIDTCTRSSGAAPTTFYVGATSINDSKASFSNFGGCLTMFAPGDSVTTDSSGGGSVVDSGTHLAAAHVTGAVALAFGSLDLATATPAQIRAELVAHRSTPNVVANATGSPNLLLFTGPPGLFNDGEESATLAPSSNGGVQLLGVNQAGTLFHRELPLGGAWSGWKASAHGGYFSVTADANSDGRMGLATITPSGSIHARKQATAANPDSWLNWAGVGAPGTVAPSRLAMAHNNSNRMEMFATDMQGAAYYSSQTSPGASTWSAWSRFGTAAGSLRAITAQANADGRIEFFGLDDAGQVWRSAQGSAIDNNWSAFTKLNGFTMATISAARNQSGALELVGVDTGGNPWHRTQITAGSTTWTDWSPLPVKTLRSVTAETDGNSIIHIVGVDSLGNIWTSTQNSANGSFSNWFQLDGKLRP